MDSFIQAIDAGIQKCDYSSLSSIFSVGPVSWQTLGQVS